MREFSKEEVKLRTLAVIPARFGSSRLEGKPLELIGNKTVIERVWHATKSSGEFDRVIVATDDERIFGKVKAFGGEVVLTSPEIENGSLRVIAAFKSLNEPFDVVANIQGDQPFVSNEAISALLRPFRDGKNPDMTTIATPLSQQNVADPNTVKVITDIFGQALYFSRSPIPFVKDSQQFPHLQHLGLYAFSAGSVDRFVGLKQTPLELAENLEQLRALESGFKILVEVVSQNPIEINTPEDLENARNWVLDHEEE